MLNGAAGNTHEARVDLESEVNVLSKVRARGQFLHFPIFPLTEEKGWTRKLSPLHWRSAWT